MEPKISIIIPCYNIAPWLPRCLDSVLAQTYGNIEIIAVNDGSTDDTAQILDAYADRDIRIKAIHKENGGVTAARLCGVLESTGDWVGFVDGDDEIEPDMYARLLRNAQEHNAQISHCGYQMRFSDGRIHYFHNTGTLVTYDKVSGLKELLSGVNIEPGMCNKLFHKSLFHSLLQGGSIDTTIKINEDLLMNYYLFSQADSSVFDDWCPYHYIVRNGSASRAIMNWHKIYDPIRVKEIIQDHASSEIRDDADRAYINTCISTYNTLIFAGKEYQKDLNKVRGHLERGKNYFRLLDTKRAAMAWLIVFVPEIYKPIYGIYCRYFQKQVYS